MDSRKAMQMYGLIINIQFWPFWSLFLELFPLQTSQRPPAPPHRPRPLFFSVNINQTRGATGCPNYAQTLVGAVLVAFRDSFRLEVGFFLDAFSEPDNSSSENASSSLSTFLFAMVNATIE
jgi:hypothetical protein